MGGSYRSLITSIKRPGKLRWHHGGNKGHLKAANKEANSKASYGPRERKLRGPLALDLDRLLAFLGPYSKTCLLYTSDAADDLLCVDLGGRRIIKKKKKRTN